MTKKLHHPKSVNYLQGFWLNLLRDILKSWRVFTTQPSLFKGRFSYKPNWRDVAIAFLLGALLLRGGSGHIVRSTYNGISPAPAIITTKPLPKLKDVSYVAQTPVEPVWLSKLRPYGTYGGADYVGGQCTYGVAQRLPIPPSWGNANQWPTSAIMAGYTVSAAPKEDSVAVSYTDSWLGHVAVVESVNPDGSFLVWEMNFNGSYSVDERTASTNEFSQFIYI